jgi:serine/threonine-protein kinase SRPK3
MFSYLHRTNDTAMPLLSRSWMPLFSRAWKPLAFPSEGFVPIPADQKVEEETLPHYAASQYYPVQIGKIFCARYQVVGKLGFGVTSTVWLARDLRYLAFFSLRGACPLNSSLANASTLLSSSSLIQSP